MWKMPDEYVVWAMNNAQTASEVNLNDAYIMWDVVCGVFEPGGMERNPDIL